MKISTSYSQQCTSLTILGGMAILRGFAAGVMANPRDLTVRPSGVMGPSVSEDAASASNRFSGVCGSCDLISASALTRRLCLS